MKWLTDLINWLRSWCDVDIPYVPQQWELDMCEHYRRQVPVLADDPHFVRTIQVDLPPVKPVKWMSDYGVSRYNAHRDYVIEHTQLVTPKHCEYSPYYWKNWEQGWRGV